MGEYLGKYKPPINLNTVANKILTKPTQFLPRYAIITQEVQFPDVSFYQKEIDYSIMSTKTGAIIIRAGQGEWVDQQFERNYAEAKRVGLSVGIYWFYDGRVSPGKQAAFLIELLRGKSIDMEVFADWERNYGGAYEGLSNVVAFMQTIERAGLNIRDVGMYTGYYWFRANSNPITHSSQYAYLKTKSLWEAWYTSNPENVLIPAPWASLTHWQFGTPAVNWGQQTLELDMNYFNGSKTEFTMRYGAPTGEPLNYYELRSNASGQYRSIRQQTDYPAIPHIMGTKINQINAGSLAKAYEADSYTYESDVFISGVLRAKAGDKWWKTFEVNGAPYIGWVAETHLGIRYLNLTFKSVEPPPSEEYIIHYKEGVARKFIPTT